MDQYQDQQLSVQRRVKLVSKFLEISATIEVTRDWPVGEIIEIWEMLTTIRLLRFKNVRNTLIYF